MLDEAGTVVVIYRPGILFRDELFLTAIAVFEEQLDAKPAPSR
jgi:hypothetical protein